MARKERRWAGSRSTPSWWRAGAPSASDRLQTRIDSVAFAIARGTGREHRGGMPDRLLLPVFVGLWSSGYVVAALAVGVAAPVPLLAARFTLAALVAVPLALRHGRWRGAPLGRLAIVGLLLQVVQFGGAYGGLAPRAPAPPSAPGLPRPAPLVAPARCRLRGPERGRRRRRGP